MKMKNLRTFLSKKLLLLFSLLFIGAGLLIRLPTFAHQADAKEAVRLAIMAEQQADAQTLDVLEPQTITPCVNGFAGPHACLNTDLMAFMPLGTFSAGSTNDVQGWTDPLDGTEYAVLGLNNGTAFIDISDPENPVYLGKLPGHNGSSSLWRELDVMGNYAYIVSEAGGHGMQIFDLTQLRNVVNPPVTFTETAHYNQFGSAHTVGGNPTTNFMYAMGSNTCAGGLHMVNVTNPLVPTNAGCYSADGYSHDAQCILYNGPDTTYQGHEICFNSNEDTLTIADVTNKSNPTTVSITPYAGSAYTHQTWITDDHTYLLLQDELDETGSGHNSRTRIWDVSDLNLPVIIGIHDGPYPAIDHNAYIFNGYAYLANYTAGVQIFDLDDIANGNLTRVAYFDSYTPNDIADFEGAWAVYPFFESGLVLITGIGEGMYIVKPGLPSFINLTADPAELSYCVAGSQSTTIAMTSEFGYTGNVNLSTPDLPAGSISIFEANPALAPGDTTMTVTVSTTAEGSYPFTLLAEDGTYSTTLGLALNIYATTPGDLTLVAPADGAENVPYVPTFSWTPVSGASSYTLEVATDADFTEVVYTMTVSDTTHTMTTALNELTLYHWRVAGQNACGDGSYSVPFSFTTQVVPPILLVDDDSNSPDVRPYYTAALDSLDLSYDIWNTANTDNEPQAFNLAPYELVIWFTGSERDGAAGPGTAGETALANWLDTQNGCLLLSSQEFYNDRGLTSFMQNYLGVSSVSQDNGDYTSITGQALFNGLGPYTLLYPFTDFSDRVFADGTAQVAFTGTNGRNAALYKENGYQTVFLAFPYEAIYGATNRRNVLASLLNACPLSVVNVLPGASSQSGLPGTTATHTFQVSNLGPSPDTFTISVTGNQWATTPPPSIGPVAPGETTTLEITVDIPHLATVVASDAFTATITSTNTPSSSAQATATTYANVTPAATLSSAQTGMGAPGTAVTYYLTLTNMGNYTDTFTLSATGLWGAETSAQDSGPLGPGESTVIHLTVLVPPDALLEDSDTTSLTATSSLDMDVTVTTTATTSAGFYSTFLPIMSR